MKGYTQQLQESVNNLPSVKDELRSVPLLERQVWFGFAFSGWSKDGVCLVVKERVV